MNNNNIRAKSLFGCVLVAAALLGCGGGGGRPGGKVGGTGTATTPGGGLGAGGATATVSMTGSIGACGISAVALTVSRVRMHISATAEPSASGWVDIALQPPKKVELGSGPVLLGTTLLPAGTYSQLILLVDGNSTAGTVTTVTPTGDARGTALDVPSAMTGGKKVALNVDFPVGKTVDLTLSVAACKSVTRDGNGMYVLDPEVVITHTTST